VADQEPVVEHPGGEVREQARHVFVLLRDRDDLPEPGGVALFRQAGEAG
jgi:hypothetical protein